MDTKTAPDTAPDLRPSQVAARLGISPDTVVRLIRAGEIRAFRVGSQWRIPHAELDRIRSQPA